ncbi:DUF6702 family protein [uncultured Massilia sp.]|uniref:DUF6702 family protein n=1 Tax=uncultured Massilia sp. TaxID=169973 RepID=UPI0025DA3956|nr:DUF6702 family protein [uncultured Massilia sp.]
MRRRTLLHAALAALLAGASPLAPAHRFHAGIADISFNAHTGNLEVVHTYMAHDVEALLANLYQQQFDLSNPDDQAVLRKYVEKLFWLADKDGKRIALDWVGVTVDTDSVTIFQEAARTPAERVALIHNAVLVDFLPDQVNTVNFSAGGDLRTFAFTANRTELPIR